MLTKNKSRDILNATKGCDNMNFLDRLDFLMRQHGLNKHTLAQKSGIPYTTIVGFYNRGYGNAKMSTIRQLAKFFNVTLDYLMDGEDAAHEETALLISNYYLLNSPGQRKLLEYSNDLVASGNYSEAINSISTLKEMPTSQEREMSTYEVVARGGRLELTTDEDISKIYDDLEDESDCGI